MEGKDTERALRAGAVLSAGRAESAIFITFGSRLRLKDLLEIALGVCEACLIEGFHDEIKEIKVSISIDLQQDSLQPELRRIIIKSIDGSFAEFSSSSYVKATSYTIEKIDVIRHLGS
jgi:molybdopterin-guanine dinucleotide biosynthesis protein